MKKLIFLALACLAGSVQSYADDCCSSDCWSDCLGFDSVLSVDVGGGYRHDTLEWKFCPEFDEGRKIKEKWKGLNMGIVETNAQFLACEHYLLKFDFDYGWFNRSGRHTLRHFDVAEDAAHDLRARVKGHVYDLSGGIGYQFNWDCYRYSFAPLVGYSYHFQKFKSNRFDHDSDDSSSSDHHRFGDNTYKYRWSGPWLGFAAAFQPTCEWQIYFNYAYHWARYRANVDEHFDHDCDTIHHRVKNAGGNEFMVGTAYEFCDGWFLGAKVDYKCFSKNKGSARSNHDGEHEHARLRNLRWQSLYATIDIGYIF